MKISYHFINIQAGSNGPEAANRLLREDGFKWWLDEDELEDRIQLNSVNELVAQ